MKIRELELTPVELMSAVEDYLRNNGLDVKVTAVDSVGYPVKAFKVDVETRPKLQTNLIEYCEKPKVHGDIKAVVASSVAPEEE